MVFFDLYHCGFRFGGIHISSGFLRKSLNVDAFCLVFHGRLVQVYKVSIGAACGLSWPSDRLVIQVLDDSTDPAVKVLHLPNPSNHSLK